MASSQALAFWSKPASSRSQESFRIQGASGAVSALQQDAASAVARRRRLRRACAARPRLAAAAAHDKPQGCWCGCGGEVPRPVRLRAASGEQLGAGRGVGGVHAGARHRRQCGCSVPRTGDQGLAVGGRADVLHPPLTTPPLFCFNRRSCRYGVVSSPPAVHYIASMPDSHASTIRCRLDGCVVACLFHVSRCSDAGAPQRLPPVVARRNRPSGGPKI